MRFENKSAYGTYMLPFIIKEPDILFGADILNTGDGGLIALLIRIIGYKPSVAQALRPGVDIGFGVEI